jgi:hypothetical protein
MTSQAARLAVALGVVGAVLTHPSLRAVMALMVWALVQALMLGLRSDLARIEDDRAAGRRTLAVRLGRDGTVRLLRMVNVEALAFALTAVATGVFSPALALLAVNRGCAVHTQHPTQHLLAHSPHAAALCRPLLPSHKAQPHRPLLPHSHHPAQHSLLPSFDSSSLPS